MRNLRLGAAALNQLPLDWDGNRARIGDAIDRAREAGVGLLCLPELCLTGYGCEDAFFSPAVQRRAWEGLQALLPQTHGIAVSVGLPLMVRGLIYNATALVADGRLLGLACKRYLAGDGVHYEPRWFRPWPNGVRTTIERDGVAVPVGDYIFELDGVRVGFEICEEAWVARRPGADLASRGVDVVLNPSASHFAFGKHAVRERFVLEGSRAFGAAYVFANLLGNEAGRIVYDGDTMIASMGEMRAMSRRLGFSAVTLTHAVVDLDHLRLQRARTPSFRSEPTEAPGGTLRGALVWPTAGLEPAHIDLPEWERGPHLREESFTRAIALSLYDYLRKSRSRGWVVSLSGGADSAAVATLCALSVRMAAQDRGFDAVRTELGYIPGVADCVDVAALVHRLLSTVYQATAHSGDVTRHAARDVARALGAAHREWDIEALVAGYRDLLTADLGRPLTWETDDVALQNIQARTRSPGVWMLANIEGKLLLSTSNRSEAAVGYATMDGDTSGGIAPIAGIDKAFLRRWLRWMESTGPHGMGPIPELSAINAQQPTAELRPAAQRQTDEADLMPYPVLDAIERAAIRDKLEPAEVLQRIAAAFPDATDAVARGWVRRFFQLWTRNQWKRERYAPSFHVDDQNLDPKTWCRFPILSGGFQVELAELAAGAPETPDDG